MIVSLDHVQLAMPPAKEDRARAFFRDTLGMTEDDKPEPLASRGGCWFRSGAVIVHLGVEKDFAPQKKAHPAFCVANLTELANRFEQKGLTIAWDDALSGRRRFYSSDPFGNRLEFI